jgi:hypothetical protein
VLHGSSSPRAEMGADMRPPPVSQLERTTHDATSPTCWPSLSTSPCAPVSRVSLRGRPHNPVTDTAAWAIYCTSFPHGACPTEPFSPLRKLRAHNKPHPKLRVTLVEVYRKPLDRPLVYLLWLSLKRASCRWAERSGRFFLRHRAPFEALFGYSQYTWIGWDWKKLRSLTCLGFKLI